MRSLYTLIVLCGLCFTSQSYAQSISNSNYWTTYLQLTGGIYAKNYLTISSATNATGIVEIPAINWTLPFTVTAGTVTQITMPTTAQLREWDVIAPKALHIKADVPIQVDTYQGGATYTDASGILPLEALGTEYYAITLPASKDSNNFGMGAPNEFAIVAPYDSTLVTVNTTVVCNKGSINPFFGAYSVLLRRGQVFQVLSDKPLADLTGSHILSNKPVACLSGAQNVADPNGCGGGDYVYDQMLPTRSWGKEYLTVPFLDKVHNMVVLINE